VVRFLLIPARRTRYRVVPSNQERIELMNRKTTLTERRTDAFVVARASARTWAVAFSRRLIPGAVFKTKDAALNYASVLAQAAGLTRPVVTVVGDA